MRVVGLRNLKNKLSEYIRIASSGETVLVTDRDRVVAEIVPPGASRGAAVPDALLAEAVRKGWISPPQMGGTAAPPRLPVAPWAEIGRELDQDRGDR
jgi:prevent-host-death family protein